MLAEIFMLRLEAAARAVKEAAATSSSSRFVPITLPVARGRLAPMKPATPVRACDKILTA
jgi:hypothetical protein